MVTLPLAEAAFVGSAIALVSGLLSWLSLYIEKLPGMSDVTLYNNTMRGLNVVLNFAAVIIAELTLHTLNWQNWLAYVGVAVAGAAGAHVLYHVNTAKWRAKVNTLNAMIVSPTPPEPFAGKNDVKQPT
jgi:hypothetical protein